MSFLESSEKYLKLKLKVIKERISHYKSLAKKRIKKKPLFMQLFIAFVAPMLIFFPLNLQTILLPLFVGLILLIVILIVVAIVGSATVVGELAITDFIKNLVPSLIFLMTLLLLTQFLNCGPRSCFWVVSARVGTTGALLIFLFILIIFLLIALTTSGLGFWVLTIGLTTALFLFIPYLSPKNYYKLCKRTPLYGTWLCRAREIRIDELKTVKIPITGGIRVKIETASTLYAGDPYEFAFTLTNSYAKQISFELEPSVISSYGNLEFIQPFEQKTSALKPREYYQDSVFLDPERMEIRSGTCPYSTLQLAVAKGIDINSKEGRRQIENEIVCSHEKPCEDPKFACGKIGSFECDCIDWVKATCSKNPVKVKLSVTHTAFFLGNASLYYSEKITRPAYGSELTQGPLRVIIEFQPNPYIATIHQYRKDVGLYVTFKNFGGEIRIKNFKVLPQNTVIHTIDREKQMELVEEVGTEVISCRNIEEILPNGELKPGMEVSGKLCSLSPPSVKTTLIDLEKNEVREVNNVTFSFITYYCNRERPEREITGWSKNWDRIYETVEQSGMCEFLKKKDSKEREIVERAISHVDVLVEFDYERKIDYYSQEILPYTRTERCLELKSSS